jgi:hypothetical protein
MKYPNDSDVVLVGFDASPEPDVILANGDPGPHPHFVPSLGRPATYEASRQVAAQERHRKWLENG